MLVSGGRGEFIGNLADVVTAWESEGNINPCLTDHARKLTIHLLEKLAQSERVDFWKKAIPRPFVECVTLHQHTELVKLDLFFPCLHRSRRHLPVCMRQGKVRSCVHACMRTYLMRARPAEVQGAGLGSSLRSM